MSSAEQANRRPRSRLKKFVAMFRKRENAAAQRPQLQHRRAVTADPLVSADQRFSLPGRAATTRLVPRQASHPISGSSPTSYYLRPLAPSDITPPWRCQSMGGPASPHTSPVLPPQISGTSGYSPESSPTTCQTTWHQMAVGRYSPLSAPQKPRASVDRGPSQLATHRNRRPSNCSGNTASTGLSWNSMVSRLLSALGGHSSNEGANESLADIEAWLRSREQQRRATSSSRVGAAARARGSAEEMKDEARLQAVIAQSQKVIEEESIKFHRLNCSLSNCSGELKRGCEGVGLSEGTAFNISSSSAISGKSEKRISHLHGPTTLGLVSMANSRNNVWPSTRAYVRPGFLDDDEDTTCHEPQSTHSRMIGLPLLTVPEDTPSPYTPQTHPHHRAVPSDRLETEPGRLGLQTRGGGSKLMLDEPPSPEMLLLRANRAFPSGGKTTIPRDPLRAFHPSHQHKSFKYHRHQVRPRNNLQRPGTSSANSVSIRPPGTDFPWIPLRGRLSSGSASSGTRSNSCPPSAATVTTVTSYGREAIVAETQEPRHVGAVVGNYRPSFPLPGCLRDSGASPNQEDKRSSAQAALQEALLELRDLDASEIPIRSSGSRPGSHRSSNRMSCPREGLKTSRQGNESRGVSRSPKADTTGDGMFRDHLSLPGLEKENIRRSPSASPRAIPTVGVTHGPEKFSSRPTQGPALMLPLMPRGVCDFSEFGYVEEQLLSEGSSGPLYLVRRMNDGDVGRLWVAKVVELQRFAHTSEAGQALFEAELMRRLHHPNIVEHRASFLTDTALVIVMEYCALGDLHSHLRRLRDRLESADEAQVCRWLRDIAAGLQHMHNKNILHCDVKSSNIFLDHNQVAKIGDLGIARELKRGSTVLSPTRCPRGTPVYMSPEMCRRAALTQSSDCWSLGCIVYEMCHLRHAFPSQLKPNIPGESQSGRADIDDDRSSHSTFLPGSTAESNISLFGARLLSNLKTDLKRLKQLAARQGTIIVGGEMGGAGLLPFWTIRGGGEEGATLFTLPRILPPQYSPVLNYLVCAMLEPRPADRPSLETIVAVMDELILDG